MATQTAASASLANVTTAYNACNDGDTLAIPAGSATWASELAVSKSITIAGAGKTSTVITGTSGNVTLGITQASNAALRVTGIGFAYPDNANTWPNLSIAVTGTQGVSVRDNWRIDNCKFTMGAKGIYLDGWLEGLIDHNEFVNVYNPIGFNGDNNYSWLRAIAAGTVHATFIEDNSFVANGSAGRELADICIMQYGSRFVFRYNSIDYTEYTGYDCFFWDTHGNQNDYYTGNNSTDFRGEPIYEIYNNTFHGHHSYRPFYVRGGSMLLHDNAFVLDSGSAPTIVLTEQEGWSLSNFPSGLRSAWPAQDQHFNCFIWDNTSNGLAITDIVLQDVADSTFIQKDRDYFMHAPASSGGSESFTDRPGASDTEPTDGDGDGTMIFTATGANAYYPYSEYVYPHPLQGILSPYVRIY